MTDVGRRRARNEDHFYLNDELRLYIVADGMGGHAAGEVASHTAVETIGDFAFTALNERDFTWPFGFDSKLTPPENMLLTAIKLANREICALAEEKSEYNGMGTTIVGMSVLDEQAYVAHVGDSRLYRLRDDQLTQMTSDHSWVNEQIARSLISEEEARTHRWRNVLTRALGNKHTIDVDLTRMNVLAGDSFALCTDGLSGMIPDEEIHRILRASSDAETAARRLIQSANEAGGHDNITVLVIRVSDENAEPDPRKTRPIESALSSDPNATVEL